MCTTHGKGKKTILQSGLRQIGFGDDFAKSYPYTVFLGQINSRVKIYVSGQYNDQLNFGEKKNAI